MRKQLGYLLAGLLFSAPFLSAQGIRRPVWADQFYEADKNLLSIHIRELLSAAKPEAAPRSEIRALIVPHAGYVYSGKTAASAYRLVEGADFETVVIIGPSHRYGFTGCSIYPEGGFETPLGVAPVDAQITGALMRATGFDFIPEAHAEEHSVEVQVPFVQTVLPKAKIIPIVMGFPTSRTARTLADALAQVLKGKKALVIASTDMSHFLSQKEANALDAKTIELVRSLDAGGLLRKVDRGENILCGGGGVGAVLMYSKKAGPTVVTVLKYSDSTEGGGPADSVVGYFAAAVSSRPESSAGSKLEALLSVGLPAIGPPQEEFRLSAEERKELLRLARQAVEMYVRGRKTISYETRNPNFLAPRGAFVTLNKRGSLRGCIGYIEPVAPLAQTVLQCAIYAATEDPRFQAVAPNELASLEYEISVLTPLKKIENPRLVQVGRHGLVIAQGGQRGVLLPQVPVENNWDREEFLAQACIKAGLPPNAWRTGAEIYTFEAIVFH
jgi:AmmeMemoRadiSam system protein B/AmmeMemoRadiSam system protein A